ncbi:hypothetical protein CAAN1_02S03840 [[Candida] anglica]|uniref:N-acetyltransferase domain-containing protein n=1 Tax=[Candida] anglica TaxID=148631 RepID=A0ABP0ECG8_9ASCO
MSTTFHTTTDTKEIIELFTLCGTEWGGLLSAEEFGKLQTQMFVQLEKQGKKPRGFYLKDIKTKEIVASVVVEHFKGFYKDIDRAIGGVNATPDPLLIGVEHVTFLRLAYVFTHKDHRGQGLAESLIKKAIEYTEEEIIKEKIETSNSNKKDNFKDMVTSHGSIDYSLAKYYLSKKYFWFLYSAVGTFYERFGFKPYPLDFYKVPIQSQKDLVEQLLHPKDQNGGKKLRLLDGKNVQDKGLIDFILQSKELEIVTELNKNISHSELSGRKSSSSLTSITDILHLTKLNTGGGGPSTAPQGLSSITENLAKLNTIDGRRRSSVIHQAVPKVAIKPDSGFFQLIAEGSVYSANNATTKQSQDVVKYSNIQGAILTNELQNKTHFIIWNEVQHDRHLIIMGMGELKSDFMGTVFDTGIGAGSGMSKRRGSSFTGLNDLGGYNFQDLDILLSTAGYIGSKRKGNNESTIFVSVNDLPTNIPTTVLHDYFLNYLNNQHGEVIKERVEFYQDAEEKLGILPMLKRFGNNSHEFELDWISNCMWSWG